jgi:peptidyl-prolyl cis-trans isomerase B (cyclophilin B)
MARLVRRSTALPAALLALTLLAACGDDDKADSAEDPGGEPSASVERPDREPTGVTCTYDEDPQGASKANTPPPTDAVVSGQVPVTLETTAGTFEATLDADRAPCTVNSFVSLADQNYFNATDCHRLTTSGIFVLQCGDPGGDGRGGPGYSFADELDGTETYGPGTLAMANAGPNTNGSQFFMVYDDSPLPPAYTVFGTIDAASVELLQEIAAAGSTPEMDGRPNTEVELMRVIAE